MNIDNLILELKTTTKILDSLRDHVSNICSLIADELEKQQLDKTLLKFDDDVQKLNLVRKSNPDFIKIIRSDVPSSPNGDERPTVGYNYSNKEK